MPSLAVEISDLIHIEYARESGPWTFRKSIRVEALDETLLIAGSLNGSLFDVFAGVTLDLADPACPSEPDNCGPIQHEGRMVTIDGMTGEVWSRDFAEIGADIA